MRSILARIVPKGTLAVVLGAAVVVGACESEPDDAMDPNATYTAFGHPFEPAAALPVQAVLAEPALYLGESVMIEGLARDCGNEPCWMRLPAGDTAEVRILQPDFSVPDTVDGRRIVVHGHLMAAESTPSETTPAPAAPTNDTTTASDGAAPGGTGDLRSSTLDRSTFELHPTGLMVEKVRP